ncbi:hypothetical protein AB0B60_03420, partial [Streptomyces lincolnensis]|uniref:hypothetical protein n=1 Tax=Streptomyces lincolnensis TaxID=1915 RepID=UPI0033E65200
FYTGYGSLSPMRNGLAIAGDYISAATVLGTGGAVSSSCAACWTPDAAGGHPPPRPLAAVGG